MENSYFRDRNKYYVKTFKRFVVIKMADLLGAERAVCHGRNTGRRDRKHFPGLFSPAF